MLNFYDLFELAQLRALSVALEPTAESIYRMRCRDFSQRFHTPLHLVYELDPMEVLLTLAEEKYPPSIVEEEGEDLLDILYRIKDPMYSRMSAEDTEAMVDSVINKEIKRLAKKRPPTPEKIASDIKEAEVKPKSGGMSFDSLERLESKSESGKAGFKD